MGKSKHNKWFEDDYGTKSRDRLSEWEKRRQEKRRAWEQKTQSIAGDNFDESNQEYE
jgi:hypothetical protein